MTERIIPQPDPLLAPDNSSSAAYENARPVKASSPGVLYGVGGYNSGPAQFIQVHDKATAPTAGNVPLLTIAVPTTSNFSLDFGAYGLGHKLGIHVVNSTTGPTYTAGAADCFITARFK